MSTTTYTFQRKPENDGKILEKGEWRSMMGRVSCCCPDCGNVASLDHDVSGDGVVSPSLGCPTKTCSFHKFVKLEGWMSPT